MYNAVRMLFRSGPFILRVEEWTDTRGAGIEGRMSDLRRPGVTSYSRLTFISDPLALTTQ
jgi:hypothetical protein